MKIHRNIILLGLVSLFTDLASQMIYPLVPRLLTNLGAGFILIGLIEGLAESSTSLIKPLAGKWSDKAKRRLPFVFLGYVVSAIMKPLFALANSWALVLILRMGDRTGKAIRNPPRDVLVSLSSGEKNRGKAFGIHRAFDKVGSIGGPLLAMVVFYFYPENLTAVFLCAGIPAFLALVFIPFVKEQTKTAVEKSEIIVKKGNQKSKFNNFLIANTIFTLGNSSNAFLILKATEIGIEIHHLPLLWALYNLVCAISAPIFGALSDKVGRLPIIQVSFLFYGLLYMLFGLATSELALWILFALYGIYYGLSKGIFKAFISDITDLNFRGQYYGIFEMWTGLALLIASVLMGFMWETFGSTIAFMVSASFSVIGLLIFINGNKNTTSTQ